MSDLTFHVEIARQRAGADWDIRIPILDAQDQPFVWPAGASFRIHVRAKTAADVILLSLTSAAGEIIPTDGELRLVVAAAKTTPIPAAASHVFDVEMTVASKVQSDIGGTIEVMPRVTRGVG
jgi:hypothetical protein